MDKATTHILAVQTMFNQIAEDMDLFLYADRKCLPPDLQARFSGAFSKALTSYLSVMERKDRDALLIGILTFYCTREFARTGDESRQILQRVVIDGMSNE